jgi:energy-coupling factor transport system substrate-specific component
VSVIERWVGVVTAVRGVVCYPAVRAPASRPFPLSTLSLALIPRAVALNLALGAVVQALKLPLYLDSVGTILTAALAGPLAGAVTGVLSNTVLGLLATPVLFAFIPVTVVIGVLAGLAARLGAFRAAWSALAAGVVIGVAAALTSVPIVIGVYGGLSPTGTGLVTMVLRATLGLSMVDAAKVASVATDVIDKPVSCLLVALILARLPGRVTARFARAA